MRLRSTLASLALLMFTCAAAPALAADDASQAPDPAKAYMVKVYKGLVKITAGALDEALEILREAKADLPSKPHAVYYEAVALKLKGDVEASVQAFRSARVIASHSGDVGVEARAIQGAAMVLELSPEKRGEAQLAWEELGAFLEQNPSAGVAAVPASRLEMIAKANETEAKAEVIRRKIADREEELRQQEAEKAKKKKKARR
jgi:tetratricopeptide (TPR) repeat protein